MRKLYHKVKLTSEVKAYLDKASAYLTDGDAALKNNKLQQASEKYWGAATQVVKAYAESNGYQHNGHAQLFKVVDKIAKELKDENLMNLFHIAGMLHTNFYEGWLTKNEVLVGAKQVKEFIDRIKGKLKR